MALQFKNGTQIRIHFSNKFPVAIEVSSSLGPLSAVSDFALVLTGELYRVSVEQVSAIIRNMVKNNTPGHDLKVCRCAFSSCSCDIFLLMFWSSY